MNTNTYTVISADQFGINHKLKRIRLQERFKTDHSFEFKSLTKREIEIIGLLVQGLNSQNIADKLYISKHTVEKHRKNINRKLYIKAFSDLFQYALAFDLI